MYNIGLLFTDSYIFFATDNKLLLYLQPSRQLLILEHNANIDEANKIEYLRDIKETIATIVTCYKQQEIYSYQ